ncbi:hypothetical protein THAOC_22012 [Thalassiosira oceanica]|uniref:RAP domain-containing protein n=1 Tax=Thalassiosira oceanica TaxID=159749 RepID=K0RVQ1_THAOC|nr:hypothetical protein THAOC_22012 [Thalassiosira oceanica]|eukprot:EJK57903.1 hypothetical protein THAOC_22012 [Thalassiosira oceanica]
MYLQKPQERRRGRLDQRAEGDALSSDGRSPAVAVDGPSPSEDAATEEADGAPSPRPPLRELSPGTANKQSAETTGGAGEDDAAAKRIKRADVPPFRGPKKPKRHRKDGRSAKDEPDSALDAPQESTCGAILASRKDGEDASRRVPDAGGRGRSDAAHARLRDSSVRAHGALVRYSSSLDTRQQRQGERERFEPNGPGPANREYDDEDDSRHQHRVSGQRRWPRFQPPELGTSGTSRPRRERDHFEPYGPGSAKHEYDGEDGIRRYQQQGSGQQRQSRFLSPELGPSRPRQERFAPYELCSAKRGYDDEEGTRGRDSWEHRKRSRRDDDGRKHGHDERGQSFPSRDRPVLRSGDRSQFRLRSRSKGRSSSRDRQLDWSRGRREEKSPWGETNDTGYGRRSWSDSTRRAYPEGSTVVHRSTTPDRNKGRGIGWNRSRGVDHGRGRVCSDRGATSIQGRGPDFRTCQTVSEMANLARSNLDSMSNRDIAAFWSILPRLLRNRGAQDPNLEEKLRCVIGATCSRMHSFQYRDLAQTSLGIAKTISQVSRGDQQYRADDPRQIMRGSLLKESRCSPIFDSIASSAVGMLNEFDARHLSNLIYSFGLVERKPEIGRETLFDVFGKAALRILHTFNGHDISNMLWAFVKVDAKNSRLFEVTGGVISGMNLDSFKPQALANIIWSFAKSGEEYSKLFQAIGNHIAELGCLNSFGPQNLSNIAWAFATVGKSNPKLFKKIGDHIAGQDSLNSFKPQDLSNTAWAFATAGVSHPELLEKDRRSRDHTAELDSLDSFNPQTLSITAWAFATAGESHPELFKKIGGHIAGQDSLDSFKPQDLSNTAWAFAKDGASHPVLFKKIGDHIARLGSLDSFKPQELSNTAWAYATARVFHSRLFEKLTTEAVAKKDHFDEQGVSNLLWACATVDYTDERLFSALAPMIASKLGKFNLQELANFAWAYSVANTLGQGLFDEGYVSALASNEKEFSVEQLAQLHQWQLWQQELESGIELPQSLQEKCRNSFTSASYSESKLQNDVVDELKATGLDLEEEVLLASGYRIDALVKFNDGRKVAVEVDGPSHFIDRRPVGSTILKHRQVARLDRIEVVSVPYWEWDDLMNSVMKQHYLRVKLSDGQIM